MQAVPPIVCLCLWICAVRALVVRERSPTVVQAIEGGDILVEPRGYLAAGTKALRSVYEASREVVRSRGFKNALIANAVGHGMLFATGLHPMQRGSAH